MPSPFPERPNEFNGIYGSDSSHGFSIASFREGFIKLIGIQLKPVKNPPSNHRAVRAIKKPRNKMTRFFVFKTSETTHSKTGSVLLPKGVPIPCFLFPARFQFTHL